MLPEVMAIEADGERDDIRRVLRSYAAIAAALSDVGEHDIAARAWPGLQGEVCGVALYMAGNDNEALRLVSYAGFLAPPSTRIDFPGSAMCFESLLCSSNGGQLFRVPDGHQSAWLTKDTGWMAVLGFKASPPDAVRGCALFALRPGFVSRSLMALLQQVTQRMGDCLFAKSKYAKDSSHKAPGVQNATKVVLVDDDPCVSSHIAEILRGYRYELHVAQTGQEGLDLAAAVGPDILIVNKVLPDMDGITLLSLVRSDERFGTTSVIVLSQHNDEAARIHALRAGADDFTTLPASATEFVERIRASVLKAQTRHADGRDSELLRLRHSQQELRKLLNTVQNVRAEERRLLAREIHDQLGQLLTATKIDIRLLEERLHTGTGAPDREEMLRELHSALSGIDQAIASVQDISILLRPPALENGGLIVALRWQAAEFQRRSKITCVVKHLEAGYIEPSRFVAGELFRICQEALTNVLRHADATYVQIQVSVRGRSLILRVYDDGKGMARGAALAPDAIGIAGMRERASSIRARLNIYGRPGCGTILSIRCRLAFS